MTRSFRGFGEFAAFLRHVQNTAPAAERRAVDAGSKIFLDAVRAIPGDYQTEPTSWPALADATIDDRVLKGFTPDEPLRRTGGFADSFEREVLDHRHAVVGSADERAEWFEYGTRTMPPRPVVSAAEAQQGEHIAHVMAMHIHRHLRGEVAGD